MQPEFEERPAFHDPPKWWHDAIRENLPGTMSTSNLFVTYEQLTESKLPYIIYSVTESRDSDGIFIHTVIPNSNGLIDQETVNQLVRPIQNLIRRESARQNKDVITEVPKEVSPEAAEMKITHNLSSTIGLAIKYCGNNRFILSLTPVDPAEIKRRFRIQAGAEELKKLIVDNYFQAFSYFKRMQLLHSNELAIPLKQEILKEELKRAEQDEQEILKREPPIVRVEADMIDFDDDIQKEFQDFLEKIKSMKSPTEEEALWQEFNKMGTLKIVGWLRFYRRHFTKLLSV